MCGAVEDMQIECRGLTFRRRFFTFLYIFCAFVLYLIPFVPVWGFRSIAKSIARLIVFEDKSKQLEKKR